jgi:predicted HTH domain antitoxin
MAKTPKIVKVEAIRPRLVSIADAAQYLGLAPKTLRNRLSDKSFPVRPRYYGGKPLFEVSELDAFIDSLER